MLLPRSCCGGDGVRRSSCCSRGRGAHAVGPQGHSPLLLSCSCTEGWPGVGTPLPMQNEYREWTHKEIWDFITQVRAESAVCGLCELERLCRLLMSQACHRGCVGGQGRCARGGARRRLAPNPSLAPEHKAAHRAGPCGVWADRPAPPHVLCLTGSPVQGGKACRASPLHPCGS